MKITKAARWWITAAVTGIAGWLLVNQTTIFWNVRPHDGGPAMSPSAANSWCGAGSAALGYSPPGCGQQAGILTFGYLLLAAGIISAVVAVILALRSQAGAS